MSDVALPTKADTTAKWYVQVRGKAFGPYPIDQMARFMAEAVTRSGILEQYPNIDGVVSFVHGTGCGLAAKGEGYEALERTQWGYAGHPNLAAALVVGLGCEVFQIDEMKRAEIFDKYGWRERIDCAGYNESENA